MRRPYPRGEGALEGEAPDVKHNHASHFDQGQGDLLSSPLSGFSRTFDEGGSSSDWKHREFSGKQGPMNEPAALDHRKCGRTTIWHEWHSD